MDQRDNEFNDRNTTVNPPPEDNDTGSNRQNIIIMVLVGLAVLAFGLFVIVNVSNRPVNDADDPETAITDEADAVIEGGATDEAGATDETGVTEEPASTDEASATDEPAATDEAGGGDEAGATDEPAASTGSGDSGGAAEDPTPTSLSRVRGSIIIGTEVTPVLQHPTATGEASSEEDSSGSTDQVQTDEASATDEAGATDEADPVSTEEAGGGTDGSGGDAGGSTGGDTGGNTGSTSDGEAQTVAQVLPTGVPGRPSGSPSALQPQGPVAARQADLFWLMVGLGAVIYVLVMGLVAVPFVQRLRSSSAEADVALAASQPSPVAYSPREERENRWFIAGGGVVMPFIVLSALFFLTVGTLNVLAMSGNETPLTIEIIGHRWWWEVRYPQHDIVTANEIHIPTGEKIRFELTSVDVIHSFWAPELGGKLDMIPGRINTFWLQANAPGTYRGQCAEYCGLQHAKMALLVIANDPPAFEAWLTGQQQEALPPGASDQGDADLIARGQEVFLSGQCAGCHAVRGTTAAGRVGPDLTHFGSRRTIGAGAVPNTIGYLSGWIVDAQGIKPGNLMPPQNITGQDLQALAAYLLALQ